MKINLWNELLEVLPKSALKIVSLEKWEDDKWRKHHGVNLTRLKPAQIQALIEAIEPVKERKGGKTILADCKTWLGVLDGKEMKARNTKNFEALFDQFMIEAGKRNVAEGRPVGPRLYKRDELRGVWMPYYVKSSDWVDTSTSSGFTHPSHADMDLAWTTYGHQKSISVKFYQSDVAGFTVAQALGQKGYVVETQEIRAEYLERVSKFNEWHDKIGMQFSAIGWATDDCDGNKDSRSDSWYWRNTNSINLEKTGEPSKVLIDVFYETDKEERDERKQRTVHIDKAFWIRIDEKVAKNDRDEEDSISVLMEDIDEPEIPLHPLLAVFDLRRHTRLRIDVGQLTPHVYDRQLGQKLVLPDDCRTLVDMLLSNERAAFNDVVRGKSGGSIILCAGEPGTGKTLTAEVYGEQMGRPLYSVQASQLGLGPQELEEELLKCFTRAQRWNAILLIDEADVYVAQRGSDLKQNAIVGVFLRVLEYYAGVLFLTTNRSDLVDDAIASRCIARIDYDIPSVEDQKKIWRILSATSNIAVSEDVIEQIADKYPNLSGRDVKNLLKLAKLVSESRKCEINLDVIRFVKRFKPTGKADRTEDVTLPKAPRLRTPVAS